MTHKLRSAHGPEAPRIEIKPAVKHLKDCGLGSTTSSWIKHSSSDRHRRRLQARPCTKLRWTFFGCVIPFLALKIGWQNRTTWDEWRYRIWFRTLSNQCKHALFLRTYLECNVIPCYDAHINHRGVHWILLIVISIDLLDHDVLHQGCSRCQPLLRADLLVIRNM